jgi:hypothetical protein
MWDSPVYKATGPKGKIVVTASSAGLKSDSINIKASEAP